MRRGLSPDDLGDLFEQPLTAVVSLARPDGTVFSRPVWHRWEGGRFVVQIPAGDRKIAMLERDPRVTVLLAEDAYPYRAIEVRGHVRLIRDGYHVRSAAINRRYVDAFDPSSTVEEYMSAEPGVIVEVDADVTTCWDYADGMVTPTPA
jgi:nitroimidazol reductase NimA-like FMN-containing flavoprotein (pyridoxamine 5'-phosphate oxidase superfamily)